MNTFLCQRVDNEPLDSHPPAMLKPAPLTFPPKPRSRPDLPYGPADAQCHDAEEDDLHPGRDIAEDFASGVIHGLQTVQKPVRLERTERSLRISGCLQRKNDRRYFASLSETWKNLLSRLLASAERVDKLWDYLM